MNRTSHESHHVQRTTAYDVHKSCLYRSTNHSINQPISEIYNSATFIYSSYRQLYKAAALPSGFADLSVKKGSGSGLVRLRSRLVAGDPESGAKREAVEGDTERSLSCLLCCFFCIKTNNWSISGGMLCAWGGVRTFPCRGSSTPTLGEALKMRLKFSSRLTSSS